MDQNKIDRLFQEKLKNLEATPNKRVWNNIESKLQKKKRRIIPFWWYYSGIAALLILGFLLFPFQDKTSKLPVIITDIKTQKTTINKIDSITKQKNSIENKTIIAKKEEKIIPVSNTTKKKNKRLFIKKNSIEKTFLAETSSNKTHKHTKKDIPKIVEKDTITSLKKDSSRISKKIDIRTYLAKKDSTLLVKKNNKKWAIAPMIGVLNSNSFNNTASENTSGKNSFSFGIQIEYKLAENWTIQSGVHQQEIGFRSNQFSAIAALNGVQSINFNENNSLSTLDSEQIENDLFRENKEFNGNLEQVFGYIEIPVEVKYSFINTKKFNTQIVVGFSSLFLNENEIDISAQSITEMASANNLNTVNFSGNFGFDFNFSFTEKVLLNLNPMFKTQVNTFNNNSANFTPYYIGIYTGLKYTF